jgi:hypothetical protein
VLPQHPGHGVDRRLPHYDVVMHQVTHLCNEALGQLCICTVHYSTVQYSTVINPCSPLTHHNTHRPGTQYDVVPEHDGELSKTMQEGCRGWLGAVVQGCSGTVLQRCSGTEVQWYRCAGLQRCIGRLAAGELALMVIFIEINLRSRTEQGW